MPALTLGLIAILHLTLAFAVWRAKPESAINRLFALHTLTFVGWTTGIAWVQTGIGVQAGSRLAFASAALGPPTLLLFTVRYPDVNRKQWSITELLALFGGSLFAIAALATEWLAYDVRLDGTAMSRRAGTLYPLFTAYVVVVLCGGLAVFVRKWRSARDRERTQLNYYGVGLLVAAGGGLTANLIVPAITGDSTLGHLGPYFGLVLIALTAHAIVRHRFMDMRIVIHRGLTIAIGTTVSLIPVVILLFLFRRSIFTDLTLLEGLIAGGAAAGIALSLRVTGALAERLIDRYIYRARANPQRLLREATTELTRALDMKQLLTVIANTVQTAAAPSGIAIYLQHDASVRLSLSRILDADELFGSPLEPAGAVVEAAVARRIPLVRDELDAPSDTAVRDALSASGWALALPLFADEGLVGLIAVGSKRSGDPFFSEDVDALATLANHAGSAVRNAGLYAQVVVANEYVNRIVAGMQNGVVAVDASDSITLINPAAYHLLALPEGARLKAGDLPRLLRDLMGEVIDADPESLTREISVADGDATPRLLLCTASRLHDHNGDSSGVVVVFSDLTPLRELDRQRARVESLANLQRVSQALAHEIGNPLVPIKTLTRLLPQRLGDRDFAYNVSRIVSREIERIEQLVERLRRVAPPKGLAHSAVDLRVPLQHAVEVIEASAAEQKTRLDTGVPSEPVLVLGDSAEIEELFLNLLTNALDAVAGQPVETRCIRVSVRTTDDSAIAQIEDSGPGIPPSLVARIFDPFVTTKEHGSGLGLAICSGIVERHHGQLSVRNADSTGAVFSVILPRRTPHPTQWIGEQQPKAATLAPRGQPETGHVPQG